MIILNSLNILEVIEEIIRMSIMFGMVLNCSNDDLNVFEVCTEDN